MRRSDPPGPRRLSDRDPRFPRRPTLGPASQVPPKGHDRATCGDRHEDPPRERIRDCRKSNRPNGSSCAAFGPAAGYTEAVRLLRRNGEQQLERIVHRFRAAKRDIADRVLQEIGPDADERIADPLGLAAKQQKGRPNE